MKIRLASPIQTDSIVDGEGLRTVIWTQGCPHSCKGCQNPVTHNFKGGFKLDVKEVKKELKTVKIQRGITFSGGEPMEQPMECKEIAKYAKSIGLNVWCYTGYTFEKLLDMGGERKEFLKYIDVLVDGRYIEEKRSLNLYFRGSKNQRIIDVRESLHLGKVVLVDEYMREKRLNT